MPKHWTQKEMEYLSENWGTIPVRNLAKSLNRTINAIIVRKQRMGLGAYLNSGEYVTLNQIVQAVTGSKTNYSYKTISWVKERGLPIRNKRNNRCTFRIVYLDDFWEWAEQNRAFLDFSKMEPFILGEEPDWVPEQRKKDFYSNSLQKKDPWLPIEDSRLIALLKLHRYGYAELSEMLRRSSGAIQRRICDLKLKERPVKDTATLWTEEQIRILAEGIRAGDSYGLMAEAIGKSEKAVRGKV
jgi:hypothetical protein